MPSRKKKNKDAKRSEPKPEKKKRRSAKRAEKTPSEAPAPDAPEAPEPPGRPPITTGSVTLLSDAQLTTLREGYDRAVLAAGALRAFESPFPPAGGVAKEIIASFYEGDHGCGGLTFRDRELALLARGVDRPDLNFATHIYFGLMEGLSPAEVLSICYLASLYGGADLWTGASGVVTRTFTALAEAANHGGKNAKTIGVLGALRGAV